MKIKFIEGVTGPGILIQAGEVVDLPTLEARKWILGGTAEAVESEESEERPLKPKKAVMRKTKTRPVDGNIKTHNRKVK